MLEVVGKAGRGKFEIIHFKEKAKYFVGVRASGVQGLAGVTIKEEVEKDAEEAAIKAAIKECKAKAKGGSEDDSDD